MCFFVVHKQFYFVFQRKTFVSTVKYILTFFESYSIIFSVFSVILEEFICNVSIWEAVLASFS